MAERNRRNERLPSADPLAAIIGECQAMCHVRERIAKIGPTDLFTLFVGLTGTGKELGARALHALSGRRGFHATNLASIPATLLESELYGHVRGAFTGAIQDRAGLFELARAGTLFLDEIGELTLELQAKLLRAIEEGEIRRVGEDRVRHADVRLVFATNRDLRHEIEAGRFREDLYWRIRHTEIHLPPLRERGDDVLLLARHFAGVKPISPGAATILEGHAWPGNVRELKHAIEHANALGTTAEILPEDLPPEIRTVRAMARAELRGQGNHLPSAHELVQWYAYEILGLTPTRREAAQVLGIDQKTLRRWLASAGTRVVRENLAEWSGFLATIVSPGADATATDAPSNASAESEHRE